jgi:alkylated DNA repair protein alkB family protein 8
MQDSPSFTSLIGNFEFDQLTITEVKPGQGCKEFIESHTSFDETILILTLQSNISFSFTQNDKSINVYVPNKSLLVLNGLTRLCFAKGIEPKKFDKNEEGVQFRSHFLFLTFRKTKDTNTCDCKYASFCDDNSNKFKSIKGTSANSEFEKIKGNLESQFKFEKTHVEDVYNNIAEHFSHTRYKPWPKVYEYLSNLPENSIVGDIGCGNGKYIYSGVNHLFWGLDVAFNFTKICKSKNKSTQLLVADSSNIPLRSDFFDHAISIAVIHHFSSEGKVNYLY